MKHAAPRTLSRTTLWRRRAATVSHKTTGDSARQGGRRFLSLDQEEERLRLAAAVIQLARERGRGGFSERDAKVYRRMSRGGNGTAAQPYPVPDELLVKVRNSGHPASLLLVHAVDVCRPIGTGAQSENLGAMYVKRIVPAREGKSGPIKLIRLALGALYQKTLFRVGAPRRSNLVPATELLSDAELDARMRTYWRYHAQGKAARQLIGDLIGVKDAEPAKGFLKQAAVSRFLNDPSNETEKRRALDEALRRYIQFPPELAPIQNARKLNDQVSSQGVNDVYDELCRAIDGDAE